MTDGKIVDERNFGETYGVAMVWPDGRRHAARVRIENDDYNKARAKCIERLNEWYKGRS